MQDTQNFEPCEHVKDAIEPAAGRRGVEVAADYQRTQNVVDTFASGEHVAHGVD